MELIEKMTVGQIFERASDCCKEFVYRGLGFQYKPRKAYLKNHVATIEVAVAYRSEFAIIGCLAFEITLSHIYLPGKFDFRINEDWTLEKCLDVIIAYTTANLIFNNLI